MYLQMNFPILCANGEGRQDLGPLFLQVSGVETWEKIGLIFLIAHCCEQPSYSSVEVVAFCSPCCSCQVSAYKCSCKSGFLDSEAWRSVFVHVSTIVLCTLENWLKIRQYVYLVCSLLHISNANIRFATCP